VEPDARVGASPHGAVVDVPARQPRANALRTTIALAIGAAILAAIVFRFVTRSDLWSDEALSVNIANLPVHQLRDALKQDGAPPLYYVLLHGWMRIFGSGDFTVRAMSGVFSLATLPLVWAAGRRLDQRRAALALPTEDRSTVAWAGVLLLASSPFAIRYATETRMYALVMFLAACGYLAVLAAFDAPTLPRLAAVAAVTGLLLYTHYWSFALVIVVAGFLVACAVQGTHRRAALRLLVAVGAGCLTFVPWLPTFLYQERHTGTPWGDPLSPASGTRAAILGFGGTTRTLAWGLLLLVLLALFARALDRRHVEIDLWTRAGMRGEIAVAFGTLWCGLILSYGSKSTFDPRYASVMFPLFLLAAAFGVAAFQSRIFRYGIVVLAVALGFSAGVKNVRTNRTQAAQVASAIEASAKPGDLVLYCPDSTGPDVDRLLPGWRGLREATFPDFQGPQRIDWVDYQQRSDISPATFARRAVRVAGRSDIWFVWSPGLNGLRDKCERIVDQLGVLRPHHDRVLEPDPKYFEHAGLVHYSLK
jgi:hypothetical protein